MSTNVDQQMPETHSCMDKFCKSHPELAHWRRSPHAQPQFSDEDGEMLLLTRNQAPAHNFALSQVRQGIETTFSQLWRKVVDRVFSRSWHGLWNTSQLKVLSLQFGARGLRVSLRSTQDWS